jgi:hypothetical protein
MQRKKKKGSKELDSVMEILMKEILGRTNLKVVENILL